MWEAEGVVQSGEDEETIDVVDGTGVLMDVKTDG